MHSWGPHVVICAETFLKGFLEHMQRKSHCLPVPVWSVTSLISNFLNLKLKFTEPYERQVFITFPFQNNDNVLIGITPVKIEKRLPKNSRQKKKKMVV